MTIWPIVRFKLNAFHGGVVLHISQYTIPHNSNETKIKFTAKLSYNSSWVNLYTEN